MTLKHVEVVREGPLTVVTIDRAEAHKALNAPAQLESEAVFDDFASDDEQWVAIVTGAGTKEFRAGHDLKGQAVGGDLASPRAGFGSLASGLDLFKPMIAAVNNVAMGRNLRDRTRLRRGRGRAACHVRHSRTEDRSRRLRRRPSAPTLADRSPTGDGRDPDGSPQLGGRGHAPRPRQ